MWIKFFNSRHSRMIKERVFIMEQKFFICRHCGAVMDLSQIELADHLDRDVSEQYGLMVDRHELTFHGLCPTCIHNQQHEEDVLS